MTDAMFYFLGGIGLVSLGVFGLIATDHMLRRVLAVNVMGSGVFMMLIATAARGGGAPDPVPHAMVLTGIVVAVSATALAVALACRIAEHEADDEATPQGEREVSP